MSSLHLVIAIFEFAVLVFSLSLHEAAHAWTASRLGDPTARMLGRVTLNPIKHADLVGTVIIPLVMLLMPAFGPFLIGWAKPTPVTPRNFKNITRDDILTTVAGPASNLLAAFVFFLLLIAFRLSGTAGFRSVVAAIYMANGAHIQGALPLFFPLALICYLGLLLNLILAAFNLLPLPPLDGSHVIRHMLPYKALRLYDSLGLLSLVLILFIGPRVVGFFVSPALNVMNNFLLSL